VSKTVDYITPMAARRLAGPIMFPKLRLGYMALGSQRGRSYQVGYVVPKGYYVQWDVSGDDLENPKRRRAGSGRPAANPPMTKIYERVIKIYASKAGMKHNCDDTCKKHGHNYVHAFKKRAAIYGLPDGSILIK